MNTTKHGELMVAPIDEIINITPEDCRIPVKAITITVPEIASKSSPGQFIMMWLYDTDEKPMGIAGCEGNKISLAVAKLGPATTEFHKLKKGDLVGIRGPFGKGFNLNGKKIAIIGGGTGIAPTKFLMEKAIKEKINVSLFHGARTANELAYFDYFNELAKKEKYFSYYPSTDDGSLGFCGFTTQCYQSILAENEKFDAIYSCGPEMMMYNAWKIAKENNTPFEASLADRYFKCAIGLCGQCVVDPTGLRLCVDGPVLNSEQLEQITDFGKYARDKYGRKIAFSEKG